MISLVLVSYHFLIHPCMRKGEGSVCANIEKQIIQFCLYPSILIFMLFVNIFVFHSLNWTSKKVSHQILWKMIEILFETLYTKITQCDIRRTVSQHYPHYKQNSHTVHSTNESIPMQVWQKAGLEWWPQLVWAMLTELIDLFTLISLNIFNLI